MHDDKVTTPTISTILLVPADGDPHGLLACDLVLGTRPPMMHEPMSARGREPVPWAAGPPPRGRDYYARALVLAHDGEPVPEGMDRWYRVLNRAFPRNKYHPPVRWDDALDGVVLFFRAGHMRSDLGTLIALDPAGRDVTDEVLRG